MKPAGSKSKKIDPNAGVTLVFDVDPKECPFREFRDSELSTDLWGLGPGATRATLAIAGNKSIAKPPPDQVWIDDQTQPLPRSIREYLHGWMRAEDVALELWDDDIEVFEENGDPMVLIEYQLSHGSVLTRSSFCRRVLSACFMLEKAEGFVVEHQWENFVCNMAPDGWRPKYHIYSQGMKPGGGPAHKPILSRNGCYLVRLFYLGAWRCVWVSDQVPVDSNDAPLLPFAPLTSHIPPKPGTKGPTTTVIASEVFLWPLLICKALLKLAAPDMNSDEGLNSDEDEPMECFDILHALTGGLHMKYNIHDANLLWQLFTSEVPVFSWDDDDETNASTIKSKTGKKNAAKESTTSHAVCVGTIEMEDTKELAPYSVPGITPAYEMSLLVSMIRDRPLKKPLPEPDVAQWKYYRWVDWAKAHGMYEAYECPRTKYMKVHGLMKLSYAPHLLDVMSTESITFAFREEQDKPALGKKNKDTAAKAGSQSNQLNINKEELKEWIPYYLMQPWIKFATILYFPSLFEFTSAGDAPPLRVTKSPMNRAIDIHIPKTAPLYLQIDGPEVNLLRISLAVLHPRVMLNCGIPLVEYIEPSYVLLEVFDWFGGNEIPLAKTVLQAREYSSVEVTFLQGRHYCRLWVHSRMNCHMMLLSESSLLLGTRDLILEAASHECAWSARFLSNLGNAFTNWIRLNRSIPVVMQVANDKEFYNSYAPDLVWNPEVVGYNKSLLHWMFRQALQSFLAVKLQPADFSAVCTILRHYFCDPDFGFPPKPQPGRSLREIVSRDPCDCVMPEVEEIELNEENLEEHNIFEEKPLVDSAMMEQLLTPPTGQDVSRICVMATEELPCGILKDEREKYLRRHDAATYLQAHWRGLWARKCLRGHVLISPEVIKLIMDNAFGTLETLSALMNEFFRLFPGAKSAFSVASALSGSYTLSQHSGVTHVTPRCKWVPYFQVVYYCHGAVKVHFDIQSNIPHSTFMVYNNDTGEQLPQTFNAHLTFDFKINNLGYTVFAHGTLSHELGHPMDAHWHLTVLASVGGFFHICDNDASLAKGGCNELPLVPAYKLHIDEIFLPNRRNILGGILISVNKHEAVSFRAASTSPDLEMVATLRSTYDGMTTEISRCKGKGEIYWPYISLQPTKPPSFHQFNLMGKKSASHANLYTKDSQGQSARSLKSPKVKPASAGKSKTSTTRLRPAPVEMKTYSIEVTVPDGWPLTLAQWMRVDEIRNSHSVAKVEVPSKKAGKPDKSKGGAAKAAEIPPPMKHEPIPGDAFVELECSLATNAGAFARRDDLRDLELQAAIRSWEAKEPGRNLRGAAIRQEFRLEFLEAPPAPPSIPESTLPEDMGEEFEEELKKEHSPEQLPQGPTPATESEMLEMEAESEEEARFLTMPEQLKDKFTALNFLALCVKDKLNEESVVISPDMAEAAKQDRSARIESSLERMRELQIFNERHVLGQQGRRCFLLEKLFVDCHWPPELAAVLEERDDAIVREVLARQASANKKKQDAKIQTKK